MKRLTIWSEEQGSYMIDMQDEKLVAEAIEKLAKFENLCDHLIEQRDELPKELEAMRNEGKIKSYSFREKLGQKMTVEAFLMLLRNFDIDLI